MVRQGNRSLGPGHEIPNSIERDSTNYAPLSVYSIQFQMYFKSVWLRGYPQGMRLIDPDCKSLYPFYLLTPIRILKKGKQRKPTKLLDWRILSYRSIYVASEFFLSHLQKSCMV